MQNNNDGLSSLCELVASSGLRHIAFIMDGNGRWATRRALPREVGHRFGAEAFKRTVRLCSRIGIDTVTVYAFSTENWNRPTTEVNAIMRLLDSFVQEGEEENEENRVLYRFIGDLDGLTPELAAKCRHLEAFTADNRQLLNIALNYGGRAELVRAVNRLLAAGEKSVTEADVSRELYTAHCADPDLIVRTGGECRLSNFLLWQSAYSELYFSDTLWPDYSADDLRAAITSFAGRNRRFGRISQR